MGLFSNGVKKIKENEKKPNAKASERERIEEREENGRKEERVHSKHILHNVYYIRWSAVCSRNILTAMPELEHAKSCLCTQRESIEFAEIECVCVEE